MKFVIDLIQQFKAEGKFKGFKWSYPVNGPDLSLEDQKQLFSPRELFFMKKQEIDQKKEQATQENAQILDLLIVQM